MSANNNNLKTRRDAMKFGITRKNNDSTPELRSFRNDVNRLFDDFFNLRTAGLFDSECLPAMDVYDDERNSFLH